MEGFNPITTVGSQIALTITGDKFTFTPAQPVDIIGWGVIADALIDVGAGMTAKLDHRPTVNSATGRTDGTGDNGAGGTNDLVLSADVPQGQGVMVRLNQPLPLDPGEDVVLQVTDAADTAGTGIPFVMYQPRPMHDADRRTHAEGNRSGNMTFQ